MTHTNKPNQSPETLHTTETHEVVSQDQALVDLNKLLTALSDYQKKLVEQGQNTSEIDAKIYQLQQDKAVLESGNITNKQAITQRINEEMKNFNSLVHSANPEVEKNTSALQNELKAYFDKPEKHNQSITINGTTYTIAEIIQKGWISDGKDGVATMTLRDIMYQETGRSVEVAKQTINVSENPQDFLKNFQQEAIVAFQKEITDSNGTIQINKFKQGFEFVSELGDLQNVEAEAWKFNWLDKNEKQALLEHMPAVQGIVGSIMTKSIFDSGYRFAFNSDNTVVVKPKSANYTQDKQIEQALNDTIARKPGMVPVIKAGLLYQDQDLLKYLQLRADSTGKNISAEAQTPEAFMEYLKNPGRGVSSSDAARAIMDSKNFFEGMNFDTHLKSVSHVPSMASALTVAMNNPEVQQALNQSGQMVASNPQNTYSSWLSAAYYNTIWNTVSEKKSWAELEKDFKERPIGTFFSEIGNIAGAGLKEFTSSPSTMAGGLILLAFGRWLFGSWKTSFGVFAGTLAIAGAWSRYSNINNASKINTNATLRTMVPDEKIQESVQKTQQDAVRQQNPDMTSEQQAEQVEKRMNYINELRGEKYYPLKDYVENKNTQNPTDKMKAILWDANPEKDLARSAVTTQINAIHTNVEGKLSLASPNADVKKEFQEHLTFDDAMRIAEMSDENTKQLAISILNTAKQQAEQAGDKEAAQLFQKMIDEIKNDNSGEWIKLSYFVTILGGTAIGVGAGLYFGIGSFAKKLWHGSARAMLETYFGRSSKNASIDNKPQAADSDTPKAQTPDNKTQTPDNKPQTPDNKTQTPDNSTDGKTSSASSDAPKPDASTEKINEADNAAKIRANMANAVNNSTLTINGSAINLKGDTLAKYNDLQSKIEALSNDPKNLKLQSEMQKSFNNFYYSVDPEGKIITKNVRAQIVQDINNSKIPRTMDEFIQYISKSARAAVK